MSADTVHIGALWDDDYDGWCFVECGPGDYDEDSHNFEGDVPAELWQRRGDALAEFHAAEHVIVDVLGLGVGGRRREPCGEWDGDEYPGWRERWSIVLAASPNLDEWPIRDARIGWYKEAVSEAEDYLASLPDEFYLTEGGPRPVLVTKDRLSIVHSPATPARSYDCNRCGWPREDHSAS